jgi:hypothetical protein
MLSTKLLPEMETEDTSKRDQLLQGMQNLPIAIQIDKLKVISTLHSILSFPLPSSFLIPFCRLDLI